MDTIQRVLLFALFLFIMSQVYGQKCECIDHSFSSKDQPPIALSIIGNKKIAFCGYQYDEIGKLKKDSSFIGSGYEIILCNEKKSIFEEGEYYTDSIKIKKNGFEIYRMENFPSGKGEEYSSIRVLEFHFYSCGDTIRIDTLLSIPNYYTSVQYLNKLKLIVDSVRNDKEYPTKYPDFNLLYLFLKAISDKKYKNEFVNSGPYDGYLAIVFRDFVNYLNYRKK